MHLAAVIDSLHATVPVVAYRPELIDSICNLDKSLYVIDGSRTAQEIYDNLLQRRYQFKADQRSALDKCPLIEGTMFIVFEISGTGTIGYAEVVRSGIDCPRLAQRVLAELRAMRFMADKSGAPTAVVYKISFEKMARPTAGQNSRTPQNGLAVLLALSILNLVYWVFIFPAISNSNN
jgi:hypothetical protein